MKIFLAAIGLALAAVLAAAAIAAYAQAHQPVCQNVFHAGTVTQINPQGYGSYERECRRA